MKILAFLVLPVLLLATEATAQTAPPPVSDVLILDRTLSQGYDWRVRPRPVGPRGVPVEGPTNITANLYLRQVKLVDNLLEAEINLRQTWNDPRLSYSRDFQNGPEYVHIHPMEKTERRIWMPDTFFKNAYDVQVQNVPSPNELLRIYNNGDVFSSQKMSLKVPCPMAFQQYPHDTQICALGFASYAYTVNDIVYKWRNNDPIQIRDGLANSIPEFTLGRVEPLIEDSKTATGVYSGLRAVFEFKRLPTGLSSKLYIIPLLLALLSLIPMIINAQSIIVRFIIGFFCLATLILHWSIIGTGLPKSGQTGAEVWLTRCLWFIAATLVQSVFYVWIMRATSSHKERRLAKQRAARERAIMAQKEAILEDNVILIHTEPVIVPERKMSVSLLVDMVSLAIFVLAFLVFLLHYFSKY